MSESALERLVISLDDLSDTGENSAIEIIDGTIVTVTAAGATHHLIAGNVYDHLKPHVMINGLGAVFFSGMTYLMHSPAGQLKESFMPDVSFISLNNIPSHWNPSRPHPGAPTLAVEVVAPGDEAEDVIKKRQIYLEKGTHEVWLVYPKARELHQFRRSQPNAPRVYTGSDRIDGGDLLPDLELTLEMIFNLPPWAQKHMRARHDEKE
jgi:Uma2 family endonuclease